MTSPEEGQTAPPFSVPTTQGDFSLEQALASGPVVLAFYTEDNTPNCTQELASFKEEHETLAELGAQVLGLSVDSLESHRDAAERLGGLPFPLASDLDLSVARLYGVAAEDGKRSQRAVFVIHSGGSVALAIPWYQPGNPAQFLQVFQTLGFE